MKSVTIRQAKYFMDKIRRNDLPYLKLPEHAVFDKVVDLIEQNALYEKVGKEIEEEAKRVLKELQPKAEEIIAKINEIGDKIKTAKTVKTKEKYNEEIKQLWQEYDKLYQDAQEQVDKFKVHKIVEENRGVKIMDISDGEYDIINKAINWTINETPRESIADKYESKIEEPKE